MKSGEDDREARHAQIDQWHDELFASNMQRLALFSYESPELARIRDQLIEYWQPIADEQRRVHHSSVQAELDMTGVASMH